MMKICIPSVSGQGLEDQVNSHFGSAPYFTLVDLDSGAIEIIDNGNQHHDHGQCHPMASLDGRGVNAVVTGGMGRRAIENLNAGGVKVYLAQAGSVREIVDLFKAGKMEEFSPEQACGGHGHEHGCH